METKRVVRRKHSAEFKAEVVLACRQPGASVAAIALRSGLNANVVYRWLSEDVSPGVGSDAGVGGPVAVTIRSSAEFMPVQLPRPMAVPPSTDIRMELRRGASTVSVSWPVQCAGDCAALLRDWLR
jgi:transposase